MTALHDPVARALLLGYHQPQIEDLLRDLTGGADLAAGQHRLILEVTADGGTATLTYEPPTGEE